MTSENASKNPGGLETPAASAVGGGDEGAEGLSTKKKDKRHQQVDPRVEAGRRNLEGRFSKNNRMWVITSHIASGDNGDIMEVYTHCPPYRRTYAMKLCKRGKYSSREMLKELEIYATIYSTPYVTAVPQGESRFPYVYDMGYFDESEGYDQWLEQWIENNPDNPQATNALIKSLPPLPYIIMEKFSLSLDQLIASAPYRKLGKRLGLMIALGCYKAVTDLHSLGFIHRHICPKNFAIRMPRGATVPPGQQMFHHIVLMDFGMAAAWPSNPKRDKDFEGTIKYGSPNIHDFKWPGAIDDMWSLHFMIAETLIHPRHLPWHHCVEIKEAGELKKVSKPQAIYGSEMEEMIMIHKELKKGDSVTLPTSEIGRLYADLHDRVVMNDLFPVPSWLPFRLGEKF